jgi:hypothetical protein
MSIGFWDISDLSQSQLAFSSPQAKVFIGGEGPDYSSNPWDTVFIGGAQLPGVCKLPAFQPTLKIDKPKKGGADSITFTATGYLPGPIEVECMIWTAKQWTIIQGIASSIWRKPNKKAKAAELALQISHPALALWGINQIIVQGVGGPSPGPIPQSMIIKIKCLEYVPPNAKDQTKRAKSAPQFPQNSPKLPASNFAEAPSHTPPGPEG